jgi:hypothetical protein
MFFSQLPIKVVMLRAFIGAADMAILPNLLIFTALGLLITWIFTAGLNFLLLLYSYIFI